MSTPGSLAHATPPRGFHSVSAPLTPLSNLCEKGLIIEIHNKHLATMEK